MIWSKLCIEGTPGCGGTGQCWAVSSQSVPALLRSDGSWMCTFPRLCHRSHVRTCVLRLLVGVCVFSSVALGIWGGRENSCRSRTDEWPWFVGLCFLFHFKTAVCFSGGEQWFACLDFQSFLKKVTYMPIFVRGEGQGNAFNYRNIPLKLCIPMNRDCRCMQPKKPKPHQLFFCL